MIYKKDAIHLDISLVVLLFVLPNVDTSTVFYATMKDNYTRSRAENFEYMYTHNTK